MSRHMLLGLLVLGIGSLPASGAEVQVVATPHPREAGVWVHARLPEDWEETATELWLIPHDTSAKISAQRSVVESHQVWFRLDKDLPADTPRSYRVTVATDRPATYRAELRNGLVELRHHHSLIVAYHVEPAEPPQTLPQFYRRSGFMHPLMTPQGHVVSDDFPPDHPHQHGLFRAWVNTTFRGEKIDFWNQHQHTGDVRHQGTPQFAGGSLFAEFAVSLEHFTTTETLPDHVVLQEHWWVRAWQDDAHPGKPTFVIDLDSSQKVVADDPLIIHQYHYGGLALRGHRSWTTDSAFDFLTSEGLHRDDGNHTRARWIRLAGPVDNVTAYAIVLGHPANFRAPQPVRLHPTMPYFAFAPMVLGEFRLEPGQTHSAHFRIITGEGDVAASTLDAWWERYASEPPVDTAADKEQP